MFTWISNLINRLTGFMERLTEDGGSEVTRWVYVRMAEVTSWGWFLMVLGGIFVYVMYGKADITYWGVVVTLGGALFKFAQQTQSTKLALDAQATAPDPSSVSIGLTDTSVKTGEQSGEHRP